MAEPAPPAPPAAPRAAVLRSADFGFTGGLIQGGLAFGQAPMGTVALRLDGKTIPFATDGRFLIGFGRDHGPAATVEAELTNGDLLRQALAIAPRAWDIQSLPTLPRGTTPTPEFLARRKTELERIGAARALRSPVEGWRQRFAWPVTGRISGVFGSQRIYAGEPGAFHSGVDVARPSGTPIVAPADGVVVLAAEAPFTLEGNLLMIDHGMGLNSAMLHLSRIDVKPGEHVRQGQRIGAIGTSGRSTGPHLHWAMMWSGERIDPQRLVGAMPVS
ncbi:peptidase [Sphingomonas oleivorans]|uniref:Peptidase n=1 Tax=Sphingomonas oleivorans TaxID=1735121 RepID=A0A2T5G331_9SPHN|nr:M23 family metallopeptidase [Sphingomonas oleivorans]PTQ13558.1 peptidase [Sphingomonas oleivorans]